MNRHSINNLIDAICTTSQDINNLYDLTTSLAASINFNQMVLHIRSVLLTSEIPFTTFAQFPHTPWITLMPPLPAYCHHMFYQLQIYRRCSNTLLTPYPQPLHLPISPEDTLLFYRYLCTHILIENKQFLLLVDIHIQDRACQITIHEVFTLDIPHRNYSACYDINTRYFGVTKDATMGLELSAAQFQTYQQANGQFCHISTPFQPLANLLTCIAALYAKSRARITSKCSLQLHKATATALPTQIMPDVWILTTPAMAPVNTITLIYPEKPMETIAI